MSQQRVRISRERIRLLDRFRHLDEAARRKLIKYAWSGLLILLLGIVLIIIGLAMNTGAYSTEGLLIGFGAIAIIVGVIRILIGFINPPSPVDIAPIEAPPPANDLDSHLFEPSDNV